MLREPGCEAIFGTASACEKMRFHSEKRSVVDPLENSFGAANDDDDISGDGARRMRPIET